MLDVMMPDTDGFDVLRRIRLHSRTPVLMLTARGDTHDRIRGLEMGADDYLPKPFDPADFFVARIRAILRAGPLRNGLSGSSPSPSVISNLMEAPAPCAAPVLKST